MMSDENAALLESLRPTQSAAIMDVVAAAGIDVSKWAIKRDGSPVDAPKKNPNYCYEWAFGGGDEPTLLCVWHETLTESQRSIAYEGNVREVALRLDRIAIERTNPSNVKSRARDQAKRARIFDSLLQRAYRKKQSVRIVLLMGKRRSEAALGWDTSQVAYRSLDTEPWQILSYSDDDGSFKMVRGLQPVETPAVEANANDEPAFVDQFSVPDLQQKRATNGSVYPRSFEVRQTVLRRAGGVCECCGQLGFKTETGAVFLETHHVVPLSEQGPDVEWNVVALCPNDHRRAHYGANRIDLGVQLLSKLVQTFPGAREAIFRSLEDHVAGQLERMLRAQSESRDAEQTDVGAGEDADQAHEDSAGADAGVRYIASARVESTMKRGA